MDSVFFYAFRLGSATLLFVVVLAVVLGLWPWLTTQVYWSSRGLDGFRHLGERRKLAVLISSSLFLVSLLSFLMTRHLIFSLGSPIFVLLVGGAIFSWRLSVWRDELEDSAISYLTSLRGLIAVGYGLPAALMELCRSLGGPFASVLSEYLSGFDRGVSLEKTLSRFRRGTGLRTLGLYLNLLEMCYREGLSVGPLLKRVLPTLQAEQGLRQRIRSARRSAAGQALTAFLIPWFVFSVLGYFQPDLLTQFFQWEYRAVILSMVAAMEIFGSWALWQISRYY